MFLDSQTYCNMVSLYFDLLKQVYSNVIHQIISSERFVCVCAKKLNIWAGQYIKSNKELSGTIFSQATNIQLYPAASPQINLSTLK